MWRFFIERETGWLSIMSASGWPARSKIMTAKMTMIVLPTSGKRSQWYSWTVAQKIVAGKTDYGRNDEKFASRNTVNCSSFIISCWSEVTSALSSVKAVGNTYGGSGSYVQDLLRMCAQSIVQSQCLQMWRTRISASSVVQMAHFLKAALLPYRLTLWLNIITIFYHRQGKRAILRSCVAGRRGLASKMAMAFQSRCRFTTAMVLRSNASLQLFHDIQLARRSKMTRVLLGVPIFHQDARGGSNAACLVTMMVGMTPCYSVRSWGITATDGCRYRPV